MNNKIGILPLLRMMLSPNVWKKKTAFDRKINDFIRTLVDKYGDTAEIERNWVVFTIEESEHTETIRIWRQNKFYRYMSVIQINNFWTQEEFTPDLEVMMSLYRCEKATEKRFAEIIKTDFQKTIERMEGIVEAG